MKLIPNSKPARLTAAAVAGVVLAGGPMVVSAQADQTLKEQNPDGPPGIKAKGAFLGDGAGRNMYGKGADTPREMASTTKVMTASVVVGSGVDLDRKVTVQKDYRDYVTKWGASTADLKTGDTLTVRQLLYGMLLPSGCDAAYALADTVGKGDTRTERIKSFIGMMNDKAKQLAMTHTQYDSFDGIEKQNQNFSTPRDMARLAKYALGKPHISKVVKTETTKQKATNGRVYTWYNTNQLLGSYKGVIGIKTGSGTAAGDCLIFAARRDGHTLVGTILNSDKRYSDATKMLDWGFNEKSSTTIKLRKLPDGAQAD